MTSAPEDPSRFTVGNVASVAEQMLAAARASVDVGSEAYLLALRAHALRLASDVDLELSRWAARRALAVR